jgi:hypothetical protein
VADDPFRDDARAGLANSRLPDLSDSAASAAHASRSWHPEAGIVVISIWREDYCVITHEVPLGDVPDVIQALATALVTNPSLDAEAPAS